VKETERRMLWVKAGGRCTLCKRYLLEGPLTYIEVPLGEGAHIVGEKATDGSPRGLGTELSDEERDLADNILLACSDCHTEIDKQKVLSTMTVEQLRRRKLAHENEIRHQTSLMSDQRTTVLRVFGLVRGAVPELGRATAARAVIFSSNRFPLFLPAYDQQGVEIDLTPLDGEDNAGEDYYADAIRKIDAGLDRIRQAIMERQLDHLSVFAIARLPLLVYLGWKLDDGIPADVYQRHRASDSWEWPASAAAQVTFEQRLLRGADDDSTDGVLITNLTGTSHVTDLPCSLDTAPAFEIAVPKSTRAEDIISAPDDLVSFESAVRAFFTGLEASHKGMQRLHVFGPLPLSAATTFGRVLKARDLRPGVVLYDRTPRGYVRVLEV
jgi:SMODS-associated and fused to various effectors sensor domain